jgi:hypothetical protein
LFFDLADKFFNVGNESGNVLSLRQVRCLEDSIELFLEATTESATSPLFFRLVVPSASVTEASMSALRPFAILEMSLSLALEAATALSAGTGEATTELAKRAIKDNPKNFILGVL